MRADRLLSIVLMLQSYQHLTARELARRLEVSERTIHRDMDALSGAGIPVVALRGVGGGWSLLGEYRTDLTGLNEAEVESLFITKPSRLLADLNLEKAAEGALLKLLASLPSAYKRGAERARQRIYVDVTGWGRPEEAAPLLQTLQDAVFHERQLRMTYERGGGCDDVERVVDPLGLVAKGSVWYLVAAVEDGQVRSYRVSRIRGAELTGEPAGRPQGFDLSTFWEESQTKFREHLPRYMAALRVRSEVIPRLPYGGRFARVQSVGEVGEDGWATVHMRFQFEWEACEYALSFGTQVEVLDPPELREKVARMAKEVVEFYEGRT